MAADLYMDFYTVQLIHFLLTGKLHVNIFWDIHEISELFLMFLLKYIISNALFVVF